LQREADQAVYRATLGAGFEAGRNDVIVTMRSATFERQRRQSINVIASPISVESSQLEQESRSHRIEVQADSSLIQPQSLQISALLREQDGNEWPYEMLKIGDNAWRLTITDLAPELDYTLSLQLRGETPEGRKVFLLPEPIALHDMAVPAIAEETASEMPNMSVEDESTVAETSVQTEAEAMSDTMKLLIGNVIILLLLLAGVIWWRKQMAIAVPAGEMI
jgi:uncharacterized protein (TIGR03503 family)